MESHKNMIERNLERKLPWCSDIQVKSLNNINKDGNHQEIFKGRLNVMSEGDFRI